MEATVIEYNGHTYIVTLFSSNPYYGREQVYHILTNNGKWAAKDVEDIMSAICPKSISRVEWEIKYNENPTFSNYLIPYHTIKLVEDNSYKKNYDNNAFPVGIDLTSYYEYTYKENYDD